MAEKFRIPASLLAPIVDPGSLGFEDTSEIEPLDETIGQERAVEALEFGLQMKSAGFNIFVSGPVGTGKGTLVREMVKRLAQSAPPPPIGATSTTSRINRDPPACRFPPATAPPSSGK